MIFEIELHLTKQVTEAWCSFSINLYDKAITEVIIRDQKLR